MINPLLSLPTRLLFLTLQNLDILELATNPYLLSPRCHGILTARAGPIVFLKFCLVFSPFFVHSDWSSGATASPPSDSILLSLCESIHIPCIRLQY